jgi:polysaccharide export outer membrane protein
MRKLVSLLALSLALSACGSSQLGGVGSMSDIKVVDSDVLPEPTRIDLFEQNRPYLIGPFDKLTIDVFGIEELSKQEVQTDAGGRISFPLAGIIEAAGKTPAAGPICPRPAGYGESARNGQPSNHYRRSGA